MNPDQYNYKVWKKKSSETIANAKGVVDEKYITPLEKSIGKLDEVINMMLEHLGKNKFMHIFMNATPFGRVMFDITMAWMHLWSLTLCIPKMKSLIGDAKGEDRAKILSENSEAAFYSGKVLSSQFWIGTEFPKYFGKIEAILEGDTAVIKASDEIFTGALEE